MLARPFQRSTCLRSPDEASVPLVSTSRHFVPDAPARVRATSSFHSLPIPAARSGRRAEE